MAVAVLPHSGFASEYEVSGKISQTIIQRNSNLEDSSEFTVFVRDCGWLIQIIEKDGNGNFSKREVGSTNGAEIFELESFEEANLPSQKKSPQMNFATVLSNNIPVGQLDKDVLGHLWLMFASQCYWNNLNTDLLTPVYDWRASVAAHGENLKVKAEWNLLNGPGSLPREVRYLGVWDETNGLYTATGISSAGGTIIPNGFIFEERHAVALEGMVLRKRVVAEVTAVQVVCSRASLLPNPEGQTLVVDRRLNTVEPAGHLPTYKNPVAGKWSSIDEAQKMAEANRMRNSLHSNQSGSSPHRQKVVLIVMSIVLVLPPIIYFAWQRSRKS
jgi:hypothetical protein